MKDVTIIIPSINRISYLRRCLEYYSDAKCAVIAVTNTPDVKLPINTQLIHSEQGFLDRIQLALDNTKSEYCILSPDDDFLAISFLNEGVSLLKLNKDVSSVVGNYMMFNSDNFKINPITYKMPEHKENDVYKRLKNGMNRYSNNYWVLYRKVVLQKILDICYGVTNFNLVEILFKFTGLACGKIISTKKKYLYREISQTSWGRKEGSSKDYLLDPQNRIILNELDNRFFRIFPFIDCSPTQIILSEYDSNQGSRVQIGSKISQKIYKTVWDFIGPENLLNDVEIKDLQYFKDFVTQYKNVF